MFQDEACFGRISDIRRCWAPKPLRPLCQAMLSREYAYAYAAVDVQTGQLDTLETVAKFPKLGQRRDAIHDYQYTFPLFKVF